MTDAKLDRIGTLMGQIGGEGSDIVGGDPDGLYIYAEVEDRSVYVGVFKEEGAIVRYYDPSMLLCDLLLDVWEAEDEKKRWLAMEYEVHGVTVDAHFLFPEEAKPGEDSVDRRETALEKRYGERQIVYPPMSDEFQEIE